MRPVPLPSSRTAAPERGAIAAMAGRSRPSQSSALTSWSYSLACLS